LYVIIDPPPYDLEIWYPVVMTQEDKDAIYGRAKREEIEARKHLAFVQEKIAVLSRTLGGLSNLLHSNPQLIHVEGDEFVVFSPIDSRLKLEGFRKADFDGEKIAALLKESEEARIQCQNAERKVKELEG
jgi:hypothetical protein